MLERWKGEPLVRRAARVFIDAGLAPVIVVISSDPAVGGALDGLVVLTGVNPQPEQGISGSIATGLAEMPADVEAVLIGVADQPYLTPDAIRALVGAFVPGMIVVPRYGDHRGNPVVFDRRFFPELRGLSGDRGGQHVVEAHPDVVIEVELPQEMGEDIDRPEQWPR